MIDDEYDEPYQDDDEDEAECFYVGGGANFVDDDEVEGDEQESEYAVRPNKTQIKRELAAIFDMAESISGLSSTQIAEFDLPEPVYEALLEIGRMKHDSARKRLLKYVTQKLRLLDLDAIRERLARIKTQSAHGVREHHQAERWRDALLGEQGADALTELLYEFADMDRQQLRQLQRNAIKEAQQGKPPKSARQLYQYLKQHFTQATQEILTQDQDDTA